MIKICLNCGNKFNAKSNSAKYCDDCKNGKIYMPGHNNEVYGELKVDSVYRHKDKQYAECTCSCGKKCETRYDSLRDGRVVSCGHIGERNLFERENLSGRINKNGIKILYRKEEKRNNEYIYHCICACGKEFDITSNNFSNAISCGHARDNARRNNIKHAQNEYNKYSSDGTNALVITSKIHRNNTSGFKGVKWRKGRKKWEAEIIFKGKRYYLGEYFFIEDAAEIRRIAEEYTHKDFLRWFADEFPLLYKKISDKVDANKEGDLERIREIKRRNRKNIEWILEYNGQEKTLMQWCAELGMDYDCIRQRIKVLGWSIEKAFETPVRKRNG